MLVREFWQRSCLHYANAQRRRRAHNSIQSIEQCAAGWTTLYTVWFCRVCNTHAEHLAMAEYAIFDVDIWDIDSMSSA